MATPSLAMIPSAYADSKVYSVLPNNGDGDFSFNRDSSATRIGQNGLIQTVGYFGSELVTNGDFATDSDWNNSDGGNDWQIVNGKLILTTTSSNNINQGIGLVQNKFYKIVFTISNTTLGGLRIRLGTGSFTSTYTDGTHTLYLEQTTTNDAFRFYANSSGIFNGEIDNVSVQEVLGDQPRLNYDISNGVVQSCPSLLLEPASTNVINYSEDFSQAIWNKTGLTVSSNQIISPDGSLNADEINITGANAHFLFENISVNASTNYVLTFYAKKGTATDVSYSIYDNTNGADIIASTSYYSQISNTNWSRITVEFTTPSGCTSVRPYPLRDGSSTGTVYIWGAQLEEGSYATSYIPTSGSSQTRAAETCDDAGTSSTFSDSEGVLYAELKANEDSLNKFISLSNGTDDERVSIYMFGSTNNNITCQVRAGNVSQFGVSTSGISIEQFNKIAVSYKENLCKFFVNGTQVGTTDTSATMPTGLNTLVFNNGQGNDDFYGRCKDIRVYNEALTDAQLQTLTTL